jgi:membrane protein
MIFKFLPEVHIAWKDVWLGAAVTSILFSLGKFLIGLYLGRSNVATTFGAAGSLAILLIWIYYSAQILFFGAEFTQVYANRYGSKIVPDPDMVKVPEQGQTGKAAPQLRTVKARKR